MIKKLTREQKKLVHAPVESNLGLGWPLHARDPRRDTDYLPDSYDPRDKESDE